MIMTTGIGTTYNSLPNIIRAKVSPLKANYSIPVNKSKTKLTMIMTTGIGTTYNSLPNIIRAKVSPLIKANYSIPVNNSCNIGGQ